MSLQLQSSADLMSKSKDQELKIVKSGFIIPNMHSSTICTTQNKLIDKEKSYNNISSVRFDLVPVKANKRRSSLNNETSTGLTPSLCSVMSQIKKNRGSSSSTKSSFITSSGSVICHDMVNKYSDMGNNWTGSLSYQIFEEVLPDNQKDQSIMLPSMNDFKHPLDLHNRKNTASIESSKYDHEPHIKFINLKDLELSEMDTYCINDIIQFYPPIYDRTQLDNEHSNINHGRRTSVDLTIDEFSKVGNAEISTKKSFISQKSSIISDSILVEMEYWPNSGDISKINTEAFITNQNHKIHLSNKRTRQQSLNTNFLRLYSIETSSKLKNLIPDLNVDENVLSRLSYQDIWDLNIPNNKISSHEIKLALITKKKVWSNMCHLTRKDLHGISSPWNLKFILQNEVNNDNQDGDFAQKTNSLVRLKSDLKPWLTNNNRLMLKPCGKLKMGENFGREIQYVVKGWCDSRFA